MQGREQRKEEHSGDFKSIKPIIYGYLAGNCAFVSLLIILNDTALFCDLILNQPIEVKIGVGIIYSLLSILFIYLAWRNRK